MARLLLTCLLVVLLLGICTDVAFSKKGKGKPGGGTGLGGYAMGRAMSGMHYRFDSPDEYRWWNENSARYPNQVYYRDYGGYVPQDVFVADCFNITVTEHSIGPAAKKNASDAGQAVNQTEVELENRVVTKVIREMCIQQYREYRLANGIRLHLADASLAALLLLVLFAMH
ncbi:major prion protein homolog [Manacus vitellinus]|uniref:major prion protein homolog n=1 Tax=Manacus vitellinus TaxID=328815 RepID=UPI00115DF1E3|nr:major prion protein homolog [Manacus vitellinus]